MYMQRQTRIFLLAWFVCCALHAVYYVWSTSSLAGAEGYETTWQFQLAMFAIFRLPFWLLALFVIPLAWHARPQPPLE